jgi:hypothetical protein
LKIVGVFMGTMSERIYTRYTWEDTRNRNGMSTGEALQFQAPKTSISYRLV